jgi:ABC-type sugar transport system substrate-binding protein
MKKRLVALLFAAALLGGAAAVPRPAAAAMVPCKILVVHTFLWMTWTTIENGMCDTSNMT